MFADPVILTGEALAIPWAGTIPAVILIDLDSTGTDEVALRLPPCPVIGFGDPRHPLARGLDLVVEQDAERDRLMTNIAGQPLAASVLVQLLRTIEAMSVPDALVAESLAYATLQGSQAHARWLADRKPAPDFPAPGDVIVTRHEDQLHICLDRPHADNAIDRPMRDALYNAFQLAAIDPDIAHVSMTGLGRSFSLGADLDEFGTTRDPAMAHMIRMATLPAYAIARCADRMSVHVQGACVGSGLEMAAFARHVTARQDAWFHLPELAMGILPGAGGCVSVTRRIGRHRAALMILSGRRVNARTALQWGLIDAIVGG